VKIFNIFILILTLTACQPAEQTTAESSEKKTVAEQPKTVETSNSNDKKLSVSPLVEVEQRYQVIDSDEVCSEPVVIEFFAYQCPHCYKLEEFAQVWKKTNAGKVKFQPVPTHLGSQQFGSFLIVHEAAKRLGLLDKATQQLFKRIHEDKKSFASQQEAINFLVGLGATEEAVLAVIKDEEAGKKAMDENFRLLGKYKITGVPTVLVNHKYQIDVTHAGGYDKVFEVVDEVLKLPSNCSAK
jgi:protein dithiol oxidoreductase (disulfide-forming)